MSKRLALQAAVLIFAVALSSTPTTAVAASRVERLAATGEFIVSEIRPKPEFFDEVEAYLQGAVGTVAATEEMTRKWALHTSGSSLVLFESYADEEQHALHRRQNTYIDAIRFMSGKLYAPPAVRTYRPIAGSTVPAGFGAASWQSKGSYRVGDVVYSGGNVYIARQDHESFGDRNWINAPSLWLEQAPLHRASRIYLHTIPRGADDAATRTALIAFQNQHPTASVVLERESEFAVISDISGVPFPTATPTELTAVNASDLLRAWIGIG